MVVRGFFSSAQVCCVNVSCCCVCVCVCRCWSCLRWRVCWVWMWPIWRHMKAQLRYRSGSGFSYSRIWTRCRSAWRAAGIPPSQKPLSAPPPLPQPAALKHRQPRPAPQVQRHTVLLTLGIVITVFTPAKSASLFKFNTPLTIVLYFLQ